MRLIGILHRIIVIDKQLRKELRTVQSPTKRTSNKSKLKASKKKPNVKYKSSKPVASKVTTQFRNKSHI